MALIRALVADTSAMGRKILAESLDRIECVELLGRLHSGEQVLTVARLQPPDLAILSLGLIEAEPALLQELKSLAPGILLLIFVPSDRRDIPAVRSIRERGAHDLIFIDPKSSQDEDRAERMLVPHIEALITRKKLNHRSTATPPPAQAETPSSPTWPSLTTSYQLPGTQPASPLSQGFQTEWEPAASLPAAPLPAAPLPAAELRQPFASYSKRPRPEVVAIGISTGGPDALSRILPELPSGFNLPILIVQHMPASFTHILVSGLASRCKLQVVAAEQGMQVLPGRIHFAPGGKHLGLARRFGQDRIYLRISDDPPENHCKPSVDYLFRDLAQVYGPLSLAIMMTGMGSDGVAGLADIKRVGGRIVAQDKDSSVVYGMPMEAKKSGFVDRILALDEIVPYLMSL